MMILWSFERFGAGSLPCFAGRYRQFQEAFPREARQRGAPGAAADHADMGEAIHRHGLTG